MGSQKEGCPALEVIRSPSVASSRSRVWSSPGQSFGACLFAASSLMFSRVGSVHECSGAPRAYLGGFCFV